jgi:hypothetical protein
MNKEVLKERLIVTGFAIACLKITLLVLGCFIGTVYPIISLLIIMSVLSLTLLDYWIFQYLRNKGMIKGE